MKLNTLQRLACPVCGGIRLLEEWHYFDHGEPRLGWYNLMRFLPPLANANRIVRYRLEDEA